MPLFTKSMNPAAWPFGSPFVYMCSYDQIGYLPVVIVCGVGITPSTATMVTPSATPLSAT